ncbi:MAG TPA: hypothetical protein VHW01_24430, partial [Polyangiaceae bacterium]|nr:hypothetical protein [Polyangiaceae bacterium]
SPSCTTNEQCAVKNGSLDYECNKATGACAKVCTGDRDCSPTGHGLAAGAIGTGSFNGMVCGADGFCASIATDCSDDSQCNTPAFVGALPQMKTFCVDAPAVAVVGAVSSAISD